MAQKFFVYRNIEFTVAAGGSGRITCCAVWPRSIYDAYRRPICWTSTNSEAFDFCTEEKTPPGCYYKNAKAAQREFYHEYKSQLDKLSWR